MMNTAKSFTSVLDGRKRKVRNLWQRGDSYYARIKIAYPGEDQAKTRRVPLKAVNVTEAAKELREWGNPDYATPGELDDVTSDELVDRIFADCLGFLFVLCFTPEGCSLKAAQRRFLALAYIYRPDLIDGCSVHWMAEQLGVTKGQIG